MIIRINVSDHAEAFGEQAMKIKFICFYSEEGNKLVCVRMNLA